MTDAPSWERDGADWPHREASQFVDSSGLRWHVQRFGAGPVCLLLHGTGAATHTWRDVAPLLADHFTVVAPDLPGHGFTQPLPARRLSLPGMASAVADLVRTLEVTPTIVAGHSAGAAILARMSLDGDIAPKALVSFNGALLAFRGMAQQFFSPLAKLLALNPFVPRLATLGTSNPAYVERLIRQTGSTIDARGLDFYRRLLAHPRHIAGALGMMAGWDLASLERDLPRLEPRLVLIACSDDGAIPAMDAFKVRDLVPSAEVVYLRHLGHLMHEERPALAAELILKAAST
jgi:magnesium chelatase accessory protein